MVNFKESLTELNISVVEWETGWLLANEHFDSKKCKKRSNRKKTHHMVRGNGNIIKE